jgi:hypothetical protein
MHPDRLQGDCPTGSDSDGFGRIRTDSRTPNMEVTNPGNCSQYPPCLGLGARLLQRIHVTACVAMLLLIEPGTYCSPGLGFRV